MRPTGVADHMGITIDTTTDFGARVERRLREEEVVWFTTIDASGTPQPVPVWFLWSGGTILLSTPHGTAKVRNLTRSPRAAVSLNSTPAGGDVVVLLGDAVVDELTAAERTAYDEKYSAGMAGFGMTAEQFHARYDTPIRFTPERLRGM